MASTSTMPDQPAQVEHHAAVHGHGGAAHAAAAGGGGDGDAGARRRPRARPPPRRPWWGRRPPPARAATWPSRAQIIACGHQSRLASPSASPSVVVGADRRSRREHRVGHRTNAASRRAVAAAPPSRSAIGGVGAPGPAAGSACGAVTAGTSTRGRAARGASRSAVDQGDVGVGLARGLLGRPARARAAMSAATSPAACGRRLARLQASAGAAGQDVVDGAGHLVAHGVDGLGPQVGEAGDERLPSDGVLGDQRVQHAGLAAVPVGEVAREAAWPSGRRPGRRAAFSFGGATAAGRAGQAVEVLDDLVDGVLRHLAVGRELAAGDRDHARVGPGDPVAPRQVGGAPARRRLHERPQAGPRADDVGGRQRLPHARS